MSRLINQIKLLGYLHRVRSAVLNRACLESVIYVCIYFFFDQNTIIRFLPFQFVHRASTKNRESTNTGAYSCDNTAG